MVAVAASSCKRARLCTVGRAAMLSQMLARSITDEKNAMRAALDSWEGPDDTERVLEAIRCEAGQIDSLVTHDFMRQCRLLIRLGRLDGVRRMVDAMPDHESTRLTRAVVWLVPALIKLQLLVLLIWLVAQMVR